MGVGWGLNDARKRRCCVHVPCGEIYLMGVRIACDEIYFIAMTGPVITSHDLHRGVVTARD